MEAPLRWGIPWAPPGLAWCSQPCTSCGRLRGATRWLLTGDVFDAEEAHRIGLVQGVVPAESLRERGLELAETVAKRAPLGVQATLASAMQAETQGQQAAIDGLLPTAMKLMASEDAADGLRSFVERRDGVFTGR